MGMPRRRCGGMGGGVAAATVLATLAALLSSASAFLPPPPSLLRPHTTHSAHAHLTRARLSSLPTPLSRTLAPAHTRPGGRARAHTHTRMGIGILETDALVFLASTVAVVPVCKKLKISPVLGFLLMGVLLGPAGLGALKDLGDLDTLGEIGILFLLFEQGLELSVERLSALFKWAFGLGTLQMLLCTAAFTAVPFFGGSEALEFLFGANPKLINIQRIDEAFVIGAALSLSSSAFVLKILQDKGKLGDNVGRASLGVLLFQDIAVIPLLVLLPLVSSAGVSTGQETDIATLFTSAVGGLGGLLAFGYFVLPKIFGAVAGARSSETFIALCLLTVAAAGSFTKFIGLSDTLGAFIAGILLAETNYRTQVEADIQPFRGILLGLFFVTTGASVDLNILQSQWPTVLGILVGLIGIKSVVIGGLGKGFGLTTPEALRAGLLLSGGGEFAFVVLNTAKNIQVLPFELSKLLTGVVVLSMALTPALAELGENLALKFVEYEAAKENKDIRKVMKAYMSPVSEGNNVRMQDVVVICGYGPIGQGVASLLSSPLITDQGLDIHFVAFDLNPVRVAEAARRGIPVFYGDGAQPQVLKSAGVQAPSAICVTYTDFGSRLASVERLREAFPGVPILSRGGVLSDIYKLQKAGATVVIPELSEVALRLGNAVLEEFGVALDVSREAREQLRKELVTQARLGAEAALKMESEKQNMAEIKASSELMAFSLYTKPQGKGGQSLDLRSGGATAVDQGPDTTFGSEGSWLSSPGSETLSRESSVQMSEVQVSELFERIQSSNKDTVSRKELSVAMGQFGFSSDRAETILSSVFGDDDKEISYAQFSASVVPILTDQLGVSVCLLPLGEDGYFDPDAETTLDVTGEEEDRTPSPEGETKGLFSGGDASEDYAGMKDR